MFGDNSCNLTDDELSSLNIENFLMGYCYAVTHLYNHSFNTDEYESIKLDSKAMTFTLYTTTHQRILVAINRGFSPIGGNVPYAFKDLDKSTFDIAKCWVDEQVWESILAIKLVTDDEVRLSLEELLKLLVYWDGLDYDLMSEKMKSPF